MKSWAKLAQKGLKGAKNHPTTLCNVFLKIILDEKKANSIPLNNHHQKAISLTTKITTFFFLNPLILVWSSLVQQS
jgi:hypothetical protein